MVTDCLDYLHYTVNNVEIIPAYQQRELPSSIFSTQDSFHEWAKSMSRTSWIRMKQKAPAMPT